MLTIGEVARRTGVSVPTLRVWEERHGFPRPERLASGHRRYHERDCEAVGEILRLRGVGLSLEAAITRALREAASSHTSLLAGLRTARPDLTPWLVRKRSLVEISRAIEDEYALRAGAGLLAGSFQRESFYRSVEARWRELTRTAKTALAFADFGAVRLPPGAPAEIPIAGGSRLVREWAVIVDAPGLSAALVAAERPGQPRVLDRDRLFEAIWTGEPELVREVTLIALALAADAAPERAARARSELDELPRLGANTLAAVTSLTNRIVSYVS